MCEDEMVQRRLMETARHPALASWARGPGGRHRASRLPPSWAGPALTQARSFEVHGWKGKREETHTLG